MLQIPLPDNECSSKGCVLVRLVISVVNILVNYRSVSVSVPVSVCVCVCVSERECVSECCECECV